MKIFKTLSVIFVAIFCENAANSQEIDILDIAQYVNIYELAALFDEISQICDNIKSTVTDDICLKQLKVVCENQTLLARMLDANSKFPYTGMLVKTRMDLGNFDECVQLDITRDNVRVLGKHCTGGIIIPVSNGSDALEQAYKLSTCIPNECTAKDLLNLVNLTNMHPLFNDFSCSTKESNKALGWDDCSVIAFLVLVILVMIAATIYDMYYYFKDIGCPNILLRAFSIVYNCQKLLKVSKGSHEEIKAIHGLRVISMMWIVTGHAFSTMSLIPGTVADFATNFEFTRKSTYITTGHLAVDTFFFISGFLLAYHYLKGQPTSFLNHLKRIPSMVFHRYIRLTPAAAVAFFITATVLMHMGDGPIYKTVAELERDRCLNHWWSYFTYSQNYFNYDDMCIASTWYLSVDWQLFLISPIILIPVAMVVKSNFRWTMGQLLILNVIFTLLPVGLKLLLEDYDNYFETHSRLNGYFIGFMLGVYMREKNGNKLRFSNVTNVVIWICVLTTLVLTTLIYKEIQLLVHYMEDNKYITYFILLRSLWSVGLAWIIYACHNGYGGVINWLLTTPFMQVLSKLTFCMYITHLWPISYLRFTIRSPIEDTELAALKDSIVAYIATLIMSVGWTLAFESPLITIEKYFLVSRK